jgi:phospholipid/cholesterol/gamma-HCH transport system substrate-binding protein
MSLKITTNKSGFGEYVTYKTVLKDASGIFEKSSIKVAGINAGRIKSIELNGADGALLTFEMLEGIKLTNNSRMKIKSVGFLGDKYLDIILGDQNAEKLPAESMIPAEGGEGFEELTKDAGEVLKEIKEIAKTIKESLRDEQGRNMVKEIIANIHDITGSLKRLTTGNEDKISQIVDEVKAISEQLAFETDRYQKNSLMGDLSKIGPILDKADVAVSDLKTIIADLKDGKGTIGKLLRDDAVVDQVSQTLSSVNRLVNRINNIEADIGLSTGANTSKGTDTRFDLDIYPAPERFFRLGIVTNEFGPQSEEETESYTSTNDGPVVKKNTRKIDKSDFKFNFQIGRRIQRFGLRAGLIESTGGVGLDYYFPDWGIRTGFEMFDYQKNAGPNLRLITEVKLWNVLFARVAGEDLISKSGSQSATFSLGLRFSDQDLAALIGIFAR